jgi:hypothetical protein
VVAFLGTLPVPLMAPYIPPIVRYPTKATGRRIIGVITIAATTVVVICFSPSSALRPFSFPPLAYCLNSQTDFRRNTCFQLPKSPLELTRMMADMLVHAPAICAIMPMPSTDPLPAIGAGGMISIMLANKFLLCITTRRLRRTNRPKHRLASRALQIDQALLYQDEVKISSLGILWRESRTKQTNENRVSTSILGRWLRLGFEGCPMAQDVIPEEVRPLSMSRRCPVS